MYHETAYKSSVEMLGWGSHYFPYIVIYNKKVVTYWEVSQFLHPMFVESDNINLLNFLDKCDIIQW